ALDAGVVKVDSRINTSPGRMRLGKYTIRDFKNYGTLSATQIIKKSSNVGIVKVAENIPKEKFWQALYNFGLGETTSLGYPGEATGSLPNPMRWDSVIQGSLAYGYGMAVTPLHLAQAYATLANEGRRVNARLIQGVSSGETGMQVVSAASAQAVMKMMQTVVQPGGTATRAQLEWYSVAGKTGTTHQVGASGYEDAKYVSSFVGITPAVNPRIVTVVVINEPPDDAYYGGEVAAPVFKGIMEQAMPLLNIRPDSSPLAAAGSY
ncbi:MAG: cell division protein FtsI (penicillin-binding protein 3), partial [Granulosicoccus sp.]